MIKTVLFMSSLTPGFYRQHQAKAAMPTDFSGQAAAVGFRD